MIEPVVSVHNSVPATQRPAAHRGRTLTTSAQMRLARASNLLDLVRRDLENGIEGSVELKRDLADCRGAALVDVLQFADRELAAGDAAPRSRRLLGAIIRRLEQLQASDVLTRPKGEALETIDELANDLIDQLDLLGEEVGGAR